MKALRFGFLTLGIACIASSPALAFSVSPTRINLVIDPGKQQLVGVTIGNSENTSEGFTLAVSGVKQDETGRPHFGSGFDRAETWVSCPADPINIASGATKKVFCYIHPEKNAEPGSHYAALLVKKTVAPGGTVSVNEQSAILLEIIVAGVVHEGLSIEHWQAPAAVQTKSIWNTTLSLKNTGTISLPITGLVEISDWRGQRISSEPLRVGNNLLPGSVRTIEPVVSMTGNRFPGPYRFDAVITFGRSQVASRATLTVWYIPPWSIAGVLGFAVVAALIIKLKKKKYRSH